MGSFKIKLVAYFLLLSLVPLAAAFWGFSTVASRAETRRVDARLQAGLRATVAAYQEELASADQTAATMGRNPEFSGALVRSDVATLRRLLRNKRNVVVAGPHGLRIGRIPPGAATRRVSIVGAGGVRASVVGFVPLDGTLVSRLEARSGLDPEDHVILLSHGRIVAGLAHAKGALVHAPGGAARTISIDGRRYRAVVAGTLDEQPAATLGVASPQTAIDAANWDAKRRLLIGLCVSLVIVAVVAYLEGRAIVGTIRRLVEAARAISRGDLRQRVPVQGRDELALLGRTFNEMATQLQTRMEELEAERVRLRAAIARFGDVLAATHDDDQLRRVIVETAVETTGASGGVLLDETGDLVRVGYPDRGEDRIEVPLTAGRVNFGSLILFGERFEDDDRMTATSLGAQSVIALENARLHRIVERQARVDGLTGLGNRRHLEDQLATELSRVERFGGSLAVVIADLDDFKNVNDHYGHPAGDAVLREFARTLQAGIREIDTAGRWGGEEFLLVLPGTDLEGAARVAERIRSAFADRFVHSTDGDPIPGTASFGVAAVPESASPDSLLAAADAALYRAKRSGKNRVSAPLNGPTVENAV